MMEQIDQFLQNDTGLQPLEFVFFPFKFEAAMGV